MASAPDIPAKEDVIRNAFIDQTDAVTAVGDTRLLLDSDAFANAREPMAQEFAVVDESGSVIEGTDTFIVINNHFKSKSAGSSSGDNVDTGDGQGAYNGDRVRQATALVAFAEDVAEAAGTELVFLAGDFKSDTIEDPMSVFYEAGYTNLAQTLTEKSTYSFGSMVGSLDHILGSEAATAAVTGADIWNINAYEYSRYNYNVTNFHDASPYRSSEHDPIIIGIDLGIPEPTEPSTPVELVEALAASLDAYVASGDVAGPIAHQLANSLAQAQKHLEGGRINPATAAVNQVIRHLENPKKPDTLSPQAQADLLAQAKNLLATIT